MDNNVLVVAFAFGKKKSGITAPNQLIASIARKAAKEYEAPIITQRDVIGAPELNIELVEEKDNTPSPTLRIAREAVEKAVKNGRKKIFVVAAKPHVLRCIRDLNFAARERRTDIEIEMYHEIWWRDEEVWFTPESTQPRARLSWYWKLREWILMRMPFRFYNRVAS